MMDENEIKTFMDIRDALIDLLLCFREFLKIERERLELEKTKMGKRN